MPRQPPRKKHDEPPIAVVFRPGLARIAGILTTGATLLAVWLVAIGGAAEMQAGRPAAAHRFADVEKAVRDTFAELPKHRADDIITQGEVVVALRQVQQAGWKIPEPEKVLERVLPDGDYLVAQLRTRHGRRFMSKGGGRIYTVDQLVAALRGIYDEKPGSRKQRD